MCQDRAVTRINGYPHSFYLVGVVIVFACVALGEVLVAAISLEGWMAALVWLVSLMIGFGVARRANARLFRSRTDGASRV